MKIFLRTWCLVLFVCIEDILSMSIANFEEKRDQSIKSEINLEEDESLDFKFQKLKKIPPFIKSFKNKKNIELSYNRIKNLKKIIGLNGLLRLDVSHNLIMNIPKGIEWLKNLIELDLSYNIIWEIPTEIGMLKNLISLNFSHNQLRSVPSSLLNLSNLKKLDLSHNFIKNLPEELWKLKNLKFLGLSENRLEELSNSIEKLINLKILTLDDNEKLLSLPPGLENLKNLEEIYIDEGFSIRKFLNKNDQNPKKINLNNKKLPCIPLDIIMRKEELEELYLRNNNLTKIPSLLVKLKKLKKLDLSKNRINSIADIPDEIFELPKLKTLILSIKPNEIPSIETKKNEEDVWVVKYKNKKEKKSKKIIGIEKNGDLIIEYSKKGIENIRQKRIDDLNSKISEILLNYLFVYDNKTRLSDSLLQTQLNKDQAFLNCLYQKKDKLKKASNILVNTKIKCNRNKLNQAEAEENIFHLNTAREIRNERRDTFFQ